MTLATPIFLEIAGLARPIHPWWAGGRWSFWRFCLFDIRRGLALDRILRTGFWRRIWVNRTTGPDRH